MIPQYVENKEKLNVKQDKKTIISNFQRKSHYLIAKAPQSSRYSRISIFIDNATNYERLEPIIINVSNQNNLDRFKLCSSGGNTVYLTKVSLYTDNQYKYLIVNTEDYCERANIEVISKFDYTLIGSKMSDEEYNNFISDKTLIKTV